MSSEMHKDNFSLPIPVLTKVGNGKQLAACFGRSSLFALQVQEVNGEYAKVIPRHMLFVVIASFALRNLFVCITKQWKWCSLIQNRSGWAFPIR